MTASATPTPRPRAAALGGSPDHIGQARGFACPASGAGHRQERRWSHALREAGERFGPMAPGATRVWSSLDRGRGCPRPLTLVELIGGDAEGKKKKKGRKRRLNHRWRRKRASGKARNLRPPQGEGIHRNKESKEKSEIGFSHPVKSPGHSAGLFILVLRGLPWPPPSLRRRRCSAERS